MDRDRSRRGRRRACRLSSQCRQTAQRLRGGRAAVGRRPAPASGDRKVSGAFLTQSYRRRPTPLHTARAGAAAAFCMAFALVPALYQHPPTLLATGAGIYLAAALAGASRQVRRATLIGLPIAIVIALVNPLVSQNGSTVIFRFGELFGHRFDVTLEAVLFGLVAGLRVLVLIAAFGLFNAVVDPDELLRAVR